MMKHCEICGKETNGSDLWSQYCFDVQDVQNVLDAQGLILATHDGADYCYVSDVGNLNRCAIRQVSPREALAEGWAEVLDGVFFVGPHEICEANIDYKKLRRRIEDALRKTASQADLLKIACQLKVI